MGFTGQVSPPRLAQEEHSLALQHAGLASRNITETGHSDTGQTRHRGRPPCLHVSASSALRCRRLQACLLPGLRSWPAGGPGLRATCAGKHPRPHRGPVSVASFSFHLRTKDRVDCQQLALQLLIHSDCCENKEATQSRQIDDTQSMCVSCNCSDA